MTESPRILADRPPHGNTTRTDDEARPSDILSLLLRSVRLRGERILCCTPASPFAIAFDHPGGTIHILQQGGFDLELRGQSEVRSYHQGDIVLLPAGHPHTLRNQTLTSPVSGAASGMVRNDDNHDCGTRWLSGTFSFADTGAAALLHGLPPLIELRDTVDQALLWLDVSSRMLMQETTSPLQGSQEMVSRILDLLFIQVLRAWATGPNATPGWLTGAMDPVIGDAIAAIHVNLDRPWTIQKLAEISNLSRSAFAERFAKRVGQPPATYLTEVRLSCAADRLLAGSQSVERIARETGYNSEAAFSRAFSRHFGVAPSRWRRNGA